MFRLTFYLQKHLFSTNRLENYQICAILNMQKKKQPQTTISFINPMKGV